MLLENDVSQAQVGDLLAVLASLDPGEQSLDHDLAEFVFSGE